MDSMTTLITRIIKRADASFYAAMGPMFTNQVLEGATGKTKGTWSSSHRPPARNTPGLEGVDPSLLSGKSIINTDTLRKIEGKLSGTEHDVGDVIMYMLESPWGFNTGKANSRAILSGSFDLDKLMAFFSRQANRATIDFLRKHQRTRGRSNQFEEGTLSDDDYGSSPFKGPGGWADGYGQLFTELMAGRSSQGRALRDAMEGAMGSLSGSQRKAVEAVMAYIEAGNRLNSRGEPNFTEIGKNMNPPIARQNVQKAWKKAIEMMGKALKNDRRVTQILQDNSHMIRAAKVEAKVARVEHRDGETIGVLDLSFTLQGPRVASVDLTVDPRLHLANSPKTLGQILLANADLITESLPVVPTELVINEKLAHTWGVTIENGYPRFSVKVGFRG